MNESGDVRGDVLVALGAAGVADGGRWLVRGVDLAVRRGEIVTLIGPNGSGKTTTARMAIGLIRPDEGSAVQAQRLSVGYVPQKLALDRTLPLSVSRLMTLTTRQPRLEVREGLEAVGIAELIDAQVRELSGGEFQRALVARALILKPDLLVLDEPVQGVDFTGELALYDLIGAYRERTGCGVLLISHDLHVVMAQTDTVVCLNGHVCCTGTPETVASNPEYVKLFGQRGVDAVAVYRHHHDHEHLPDGRVRHRDGSITEPGDAGHIEHRTRDAERGHA